MQGINHRLTTSNEIHLVFDNYDNDSPDLKQDERDCRYATGGKTYSINGNRILSEFLFNNKNEYCLTEFISVYLKDHLTYCDILDENLIK